MDILPLDEIAGAPFKVSGSKPIVYATAATLAMDFLRTGGGD